ncbi:MAG: hypothetical protein WAM82_02390 [Thermoanaerobaculia bacterium]
MGVDLATIARLLRGVEVVVRTGADGERHAVEFGAQPELAGEAVSVMVGEVPFIDPGCVESIEAEAARARERTGASVLGAAFRYPATKGRAGGKLPVGKGALRSPRLSRSEASRKAATKAA